MHLWTVATNKTYHNITIFRRGYRISERGEGFGLLLTTKTWSISAHARDVFPLFIKFCGPPKENKKRGGGRPYPQDAPPMTQKCLAGLISRPFLPGPDLGRELRPVPADEQLPLHIRRPGTSGRQGIRHA